MKVKFQQQKSSRVKGLSFHPIRPWILVSYHNGEVKLWDYRIKSLVDNFVAHDGPTRAVSFHPNQPLFVTGGDDNLIKVWNYKQRKHQFTLKGHLDYIRTCEFHNELPWILSSSDDQTIRIWNYQSRSQLAILTGHSHYIMCAQFHPTKDLIVSSSLDQTLRLWDFSAIKNKSKQSSSSSQQHHLYGAEIEIVGVMESHDRGVNWCAFHPSQNMILSASDDRKVKLWKFTDSKTWEHDTLFGHNSNVSSGIFHPLLDIIITNSEDKTTRVWSLDKKTQIDQVKKDTDRYWICAAHPDQYVYAAGHDSGFEIVGLIKEKQPSVIVDTNSVVVGYRKLLRVFDFRNGNSYELKNFENNSDNVLHNNILDIVFNIHDNHKPSMMVSFDLNEKNGKDQMKKFELLQFSSSNLKDSSQQSKSFQGLQALFVTKNKIAKLNQNKDVDIYNVELDQTSSNYPGLKNVNKIFQGPVGKLIAVNDEQIMIYDINTKKSVVNMPFSSEFNSLKYVVWNKTGAFVAFVCKKQIHIFTKTLQKISSFIEKFNIKSCVWTKDNCIIYSTINHVKYGLLNNDSGILKCTDTTLRIVKLENKDLFVVNRNAELQKIQLKLDEYQLKIALQEKNWEKTQKIMHNLPSLGNSVVSYLYKKNYAGLALNLVEDKKAQFSLALGNGNLDTSFQVANELKDKQLYKQFAKEALRQGQMQVYENNPNVEMAYRQTKEYDKLQFLYLITGQQQKLNAINQIAQKKGDNQSRFQNSLYTGDIKERIKVLSEIGQLPLAYMTAISHGQTEMAELLKKSVDNPEYLLQQVQNLQGQQKAMVPPQPLVRNIKSSEQALRNWPLNHIPEEYQIIQNRKTSQEEKLQEMVQEQKVNNLIEDDDDNNYEEDQEESKQNNNVDLDGNVDDMDMDDGAGDWGIDDAEVPEQQEEEQVQQEQKQTKSKTMKQDIYKRQENMILRNGKTSQIIGEQTAVGYYEQVFSTLKKQLGIVNYEPLKNIIMKIQSYSQVCVPQIGFVQNVMNYIPADNNIPFVYLNINLLSQQITQKAYKQFSKGGPAKFKETMSTFVDILHSVPFVQLKSDEDLKNIQKIIRICVEYIISMKLYLQIQKQPARKSELIVYMGLCNLQGPHREITMRQAQSTLYNDKNYIYASFFAKKIIRTLENTDKQQIVNNSKKILAECEKQGTNKSEISLEEGWLYDDDFAYTLDCETFEVVEGNLTKCPFCGARYDKSKEGKICSVCEIAKIGQQTLGFKVNK